VLLPAIAPSLGGTGGAGAGMANVALSVAVALGKVVVFVAIMYVVGRRFVPWLLAHVARLGSRELFTLAVIGTALCVGTIAAQLFGVSVALGAFFAGAVISESELSQRAAAEALPMQDAFAVLFFVSVGMLFDPRVLVEHPGRVLALVGLVVLWKSALAFGIVRALGESPRTALVVGTALGQVGEFSFIVAGVGITLGLVSPDVLALVVAAAIAAITINAGTLGWAIRAAQALRRGTPAEELAAARATREMRVAAAPGDAHAGTVDDPFEFTDLAGHVVLVGYGRVGATVADALGRAGSPFVVIEEQDRIVGGLRRRGEHAIQGDATRADVLDRAGIAQARLLVVTAPEPFRARRIVEVAREANPRLAIAVRTHSAAEQNFFEELLASGGTLGRAVYAEREAALNLSHFALIALGRSDDEADWIVGLLRGMPIAPTETFRSLATQEFRSMTGNGVER
jgi:CPA2 family monovalent cation:H+ antiporter-2